MTIIPLPGIYAKLVADALGIQVTSWLRSKEENERVGGHPQSFHLSGLALDFAPDTTESTIEKFVKFTGWQVVDERINFGTGSGSHWHTEHDGTDIQAAVVGGLFLAGFVAMVVHSLFRKD